MSSGVKGILYVLESGILDYFEAPWRMVEKTWGSADWDGAFINISLSTRSEKDSRAGYRVLHELAHWLLASEERRHSSQFLLNARKRTTPVSREHRKREEYRAGVLSLVYGYSLGMIDTGVPAYFSALNYTEKQHYGIELGAVGLRGYPEGMSSEALDAFESAGYDEARSLRLAFSFLDRAGFLRGKFVAPKAKSAVWETINGLIVLGKAGAMFGEEQA
jgi:hypothetical protein